MIDVKELFFHYSKGIDLFREFSFQVNRSEAWTIIGPSGCGKSTLLFLIAGLIRPTRGKILVDGQHITRPRPSTGLVLQDHGLLPWANVEKNTRLGLEVRKFYGPDGKHSPADLKCNQKDDDARINHWLKWLGIDGLKTMYPSQLSRGQRQRAAIARTLVLQPDLLLMDEPFSALDAPIREELQMVMNRFHLESGLTSLTVTHDIEEAVVLGEKILVLNDRCNSKPLIISNHLSGDRCKKNSSLFIDRCRELKAILVSGRSESQ